MSIRCGQFDMPSFDLIGLSIGEGLELEESPVASTSNKNAQDLRGHHAVAKEGSREAGGQGDMPSFDLTGLSIGGGAALGGSPLASLSQTIAHQSNRVTATAKNRSRPAGRLCGHTQRQYKRDKGCTCSACALRISDSSDITKWGDSKAKIMLRDLLENDSDHRYWNDPPGKVYDDNRAQFHLYKYDRFRDNLNALEKCIRLDEDEVEFDEHALKKESMAFPRSARTGHGRPYYDTSATRQLLVQMAKEGKLHQYKNCPRKLRASNPIFQEYPDEIFRSQLNREKQRRAETVGWQHRRNIRGCKKQLEKYENTNTE